MAKTIGIVACSAHGAALCYTTICVEAQEMLGRYAHPEIFMHSLPFDEYVRHIEAGEWEAVGRLMLRSAVKLAQGGAELLICPDNTIHQAFDLVREHSPLPWLHIAEAVGAEAVRRNFQCLAILGTRYLMEGSVYPDALDAQGIAFRTPAPEARERLNRIIFEELVNGRVVPESRDYAAGLIQDLKETGCDAVVLGCTELPLLIPPDVSPLPTLDSTRLLARAALKEAVSPPCAAKRGTPAESG